MDDRIEKKEIENAMTGVRIPATSKGLFDV